VLYGLSGDDTLDGGSGADRLWGHQGDDTIRARDGVKDVIRCGQGDDRVIADEDDAVAEDCEVVLRD
jgi:Ca2+-binding RTX toxin-like protein